jgi:hypothetical protein
MGSNASGSAAAAFSATPMSLTLAVPLVGAGAVFVSNDTPPGSITSTAKHSPIFAPSFLPMWAGPTVPGLLPLVPPEGLHMIVARMGRLQHFKLQDRCFGVKIPRFIFTR